MPFHSLIIPNRDRNERVDVCLWSLAQSARECGASDFEAVVVDSGSSTESRYFWPWVKVIRDPVPPDMFNKSRCLNIGIDATDSAVVTILDADAVVGPRFMEAAGVLDDPTLVRCCYRVRDLPVEAINELRLPDVRKSRVARYFEKYDEYPLAYEAYGQHDRCQPPEQGMEPWGNSQFSIRRRTLRNIRFDEDYVGRGPEDLDLNMQIEAAFGAKYRGHIWTDGPHAMFHIEQPDDPLYRRKNLVENVILYRKKRASLLGR